MYILTLVRRDWFRAGTSTEERSHPFADATAAVDADADADAMDAAGAPSGAACGRPSAASVPMALVDCVDSNLEAEQTQKLLSLNIQYIENYNNNLEKFSKTQWKMGMHFAYRLYYICSIV